MWPCRFQIAEVALVVVAKGRAQDARRGTQEKLISDFWIMVVVIASVSTGIAHKADGDIAEVGHNRGLLVKNRYVLSSTGSLGAWLLAVNVIVMARRAHC